ncbi:extracellular solute-binding protein [Reinekea sp.]|jgi:sorbitol/mannitol transport system substrate-binding protein|uniref:extracellular solute-binding protein n=1 Tax=Reinekea sp. TaxID=1970455 RepID=UPI002A7F515F|nr:extracellular solute-binding protein [Reinekea sp.]
MFKLGCLQVQYGWLKNVKKITLALLCILATLSYAQTNLTLSSFDLPPYIGQDLKDQGAIHEIVEAVLAEAERSVDVAFFPVTRAINSALAGQYQAVFPVVYDELLSKGFRLSDAIASYQLGLLGRKNDDSYLESISVTTTIAVVRGSVSEQENSSFSPARFVYVAQNEQAMRMLHSGRVDYVLIDKFTAADLMVDKLPYMIGQFSFPEQFTKKIDLHVAFSKKYIGAQTDLEAFNSALKRLEALGVIDSILNRHGLLFFEKPLQNKVLRIATVDNGDMVLMQRISAEYKQLHPDITLDWRVLDESILRRRLLSDLAISEGQYDVMTIGAYEVPIWNKQDWLTPLTNLSVEYDQGDMIEVVRDSLSHNGSLYALPFYAESSMTYFRRDLFEQAGIQMPAAPTWANIRSYAKKLHAPEQGVYGICLRGKVGWGENIPIVSTMVNAFGGQWFDMQWAPQLNSPAWQQAVSFYVDLVRDFGPPDTYKNGFPENLKLFSDGHCAIWIDATVAAGMLFDANRSAVADRVWFAPAPVSLTSKGSAWLWIWSLAVPASSKLQVEAKEFIAWATSKDYINRVAELEGWVAVPPGTRKSTYENENYIAAAPFAEYVLSAINSANPKDATLPPSPYSGIQFVTIPEFTAIGNFASQRINGILQNKMTVEQALSKSQAFTINLMKNARARR